jgi:hypothetical protein
MTIGAIGANASLLLGMLGKSRVDAAPFQPSGLPCSENSAGPLSILPISSAQPLSFDNVLQLQRLDEPEPEIRAPAATEIFLKEARKGPMERMREQIMQQLGVTEADLAAMPPEEKRAMEDRIRQLIEEKLRQGMGVDNAEADSNAAELQTLIGV